MNVLAASLLVMTEHVPAIRAAALASSGAAAGAHAAAGRRRGCMDARGESGRGGGKPACLRVLPGQNTGRAR